MDNWLDEEHLDEDFVADLMDATQYVVEPAESQWA